jgi:hypothetical protein
MYLRLGLALCLLSSAPAWGQELMEPYAPSPAAAPVAPPQVTPVPPPPPRYYYYQPYAPPPYAPPRYLRAPVLSYHEVERPRYGLMTGGLVTFGVSWSLTALIGYLANENRVAIPIVGPLLVAHSLDTDPWNAGNRAGVVFLVFDSLIQTAGVAMAIAGAATHRRVRIYDRVAVVPAALPAGVGVAAAGHF